MLRHRFQPGRLVAGLFLTLAGVIYVGDAGGLWKTPWFVVIPVVMGGLCLAGAVGVVARSAHRRRGTLRAKADGPPGGPAG
ncbi:hypothetical protein ACFFKE_20670 [Streptomyces mutabilis]|uniref:Uncharacterized protein n=1 Tax=Streptomyces mutabilis TaxID=67332 RepID=A0A086MZ36_9ACTN|nr:hypothetical protein [Streptomyces mutabilis]KFG74154.1 hypothetical protein FM21_25620 [Streptomyces mutabilis]GGQ05917.1 hypothetical protein GCM10010279_11470 [Streptomyces mutabilis]